MSIIKAFQVACVAIVAYKVGTGSYKFGKCIGRVGGTFEFLLANGYTQEELNTMSAEDLEDIVHKMERAA